MKKLFVTAMAVLAITLGGCDDAQEPVQPASTGVAQGDLLAAMRKRGYDPMPATADEGLSRFTSQAPGGRAASLDVVGREALIVSARLQGKPGVELWKDVATMIGASFPAWNGGADWLNGSIPLVAEDGHTMSYPYQGRANMVLEPSPDGQVTFSILTLQK